MATGKLLEIEASKNKKLWRPNSNFVFKTHVRILNPKTYKYESEITS